VTERPCTPMRDTTMTPFPESWRDLAGRIGWDRGEASASSRVMQAAEMLEIYDVIDECTVCGADLVAAVAFASAAVAHYALAGEEAAEAASALEALVRASGVETSSRLRPRCALHGDEAGMEFRGAGA
jgi:hypothetical protein